MMKRIKPLCLFFWVAMLIAGVAATDACAQRVMAEKTKIMPKGPESLAPVLEPCLEKYGLPALERGVKDGSSFPSNGGDEKGDRRFP